MAKRSFYAIALILLIMGGILTLRGRNEDGSAVAPLTYLQEEIDPCTPVHGSGRDPCEIRGAPNLTGNAYTAAYAEIPAYWDLYYDQDEPLSVFTPHVVVRGTFLSNTTRCDVYRRVFPAFVDFPMGDDDYLAICFMDARINDYLIGTGPSKLTIAAYTEPILYERGDSLEWLDKRRDGTVEALEGREGVLFLGPASTTELESWWMIEFWDVQLNGDAVSVVAPYKESIENNNRGRFTEEELALLKRSLSEFEAVISKGAVARADDTGGRIAVGDNLPMLITDANLLHPYYEGPGVGISYETDAPLLPPPVPGGEDPEQPPVTTGEEDDGSSGSVPVPGGEDQPDGGGGGVGP